MVTVALMTLAVLGVWAVFVIASPVRRCSWCKGTRRARRHRHWGATGACRKCQARGKHARLGAGLLHRMRLLIRDDIRERRDK